MGPGHSNRASVQLHKLDGVLGRPRAQARIVGAERQQRVLAAARSPTAGCRPGPRGCRTRRSSTSLGSSCFSSRSSTSAPYGSTSRRGRAISDDALHRRQLLGLADVLAEGDRLLGRHGIAVHDVQRIVRLAPCAAWRSRARCRRRRRRCGPRPLARSQATLRDLLVDDVERLVDPAARRVEQPQAAERQRRRTGAARCRPRR